MAQSFHQRKWEQILDNRKTNGSQSGGERLTSEQRDALKHERESPTGWSFQTLMAAVRYSYDQEHIRRAGMEAEHDAAWEPLVLRREQEQADHETRRERYELYEGNFETWLDYIQTALEQHQLGLSSHVHQFNDLSSDSEQWEADDHWAANIIMDNVPLDFFLRQPAQESPTAYELICHLKAGCQPFHFLDLPQELRDYVYEYALIQRPRDLPTGDSIGMKTRTRHIRVLLDDSRVSGYTSQFLPTPSLLHVNSQVRSEAGRIYFENNKFDIAVKTRFPWNPLATVETWARVWVRDFAQHLRDVRLHVTLHNHNRGNYMIRVKASQNGQLSVTTEGENQKFAIRHGKLHVTGGGTGDGLQEYIKGVNEESKARGWKGEGIIHFLAGDEERLRRAFFGPPVKNNRLLATWQGSGTWQLCPANDPDVYNWIW